MNFKLWKRISLLSSGGKWKGKGKLFTALERTHCVQIAALKIQKAHQQGSCLDCFWWVGEREKSEWNIHIVQLSTNSTEDDNMIEKGERRVWELERESGRIIKDSKISFLIHLHKLLRGRNGKETFILCVVFLSFHGRNFILYIFLIPNHPNEIIKKLSSDAFGWPFLRAGC